MIKEKLIACFILTFISLGTLSWSQDNIKVFVYGSGFEITLDNKTYKFTESKQNHFTIRDYYEFTAGASPGTYKLPTRDILVAIPPDSKPNISMVSSSEQRYSYTLPALNPKLELENDSIVKIVELNYSERVKTSKSIPNFEVKEYFWFRDFYCAHIRLNTHTFDEQTNSLVELFDIKLKFEFSNIGRILNDSPLQIKSDFDENLKLLIVNSGIAEQFRSNPKLLLNDTTGNWINYGANYVKLGTGSDGIFRITKTNLESWGVGTAGINPKTFQLFESGVELPIHVFGEADFTFDNGDYIEFYGTKNYSKISPRIINADNMPYNDYLDKYTDTTMYFLVWNVTNGQRALNKNTYLPAITDSIDYYTYFTHLEENGMDALFYTFHNDLVASQFPFWDTGKGWYWKFIATWASTSNHTVTISDLVPNKTARFFGKLSSRGSTGFTNVHMLKMFINSVKIDSQVTDRYERVLLNGTINSNSLVNGNNSLSITYAEANGASNGQLLLDWVEAEYPRKIKLTNNSLYFQFKDTLLTSVRKVKIENVPSSNYSLFKVKPQFQRITSFILSGGNLYFTDTVSTNDAYYLVQQGTFTTPKFFKYKSFVNLRNQNNQVDYLAITHPSFLSSVNNYVNYISSSFSVTKSVTSVEDIFDEFGFGYPTSESIREYIMYKFQNSPLPKPSYLVLIGDANYDFKKYRFYSQGVIGGGNYIPSYGFPVSDQYYAVWNTGGFPIPQMQVGRIPLNKSSEMDYYKSKVQNNIEKPFDDWNKKYLFFSGGRGNYPDEVKLYKSINDSVINNFVAPPPLAGHYHHFYKTTNPVSDFGPYPGSEIRQAISEGAVFISYIGHSGTATWDNSISDVRQLKNDVNRNPVISDFGCSTNKFAEPDIISFGELFILDPDGQALGYIGNSALGFVTTAFKGPGNFYKHVVVDSIHKIGKAHLMAKQLMFEQLGNTNVSAQFAWANTLMGDPIVKMQIPTRPNLSIKQTDFILENKFVNDAYDSVMVKISLNNYGTVIPQTFNLRFVHTFKGSLVKQIDSLFSLPYFKDTISFWINVKKKAGQHSVQLTLDTENQINEIYENDNNINLQFNVASANIRDLIVNRSENPKLDSLTLLMPTVKPDKPQTINLQIADNEQFTNFLPYSFGLDTFYSKLSFSTPISHNRSWLRFKLEDDEEWSNTLSYSKLSGSKFFIGDNYSWNKQTLSNLRISTDTVNLSLDTVAISIISAGNYSGQYCIITRKGINLLSNTFFQGIGIVVLNEKTFTVDTTAWFELFNNSAGTNACIAFINSIPAGKLVALGVSGDAKNNPSTALNNAVVSLGGTRFPSLLTKAPYALFGKKGADSTQVKQIIKNPVEGPIYLDTTQIVPYISGTLMTVEVGPASEWKKLKVSQITQNNSEIKYRPVGIKPNGEVDTLSYLNVVANQVDLSTISANTYPFLKIRAEFKADSLYISPRLNKLEVDYKGVAELGTNYQVVTLNKDTLEQGQKGKITFQLVNAGEATASNINVNVDVIRPDNSSVNILDQQVSTLAPGEKKLIIAGFDTEFEAGDRQYRISIDSNDQVLEYYNDNNVYSAPFFIIRDTTKPIIIVTFDGKEIVDGDYVSTTPKIRMELSDPSLLPIYDTSSLTIQLDEQPIYFAKNNGTLTYSFNPENPKMVVEYKPKFSDGEHTIKIFANDGFGNLADSLGLEKKFIVSSETKILDVFNYPNPIRSNTHFTFRLTQIPDEVKILVYTIAGRLVKEIIKKNNDLSQDFNKIFWDTRDEDGDLLGNGTYLYKVIMSAGDKTETSVHKLAIVR